MYHAYKYNVPYTQIQCTIHTNIITAKTMYHLTNTNTINTMYHTYKYNYRKYNVPSYKYKYYKYNVPYIQIQLPQIQCTTHTNTITANTNTM